MEFQVCVTLKEVNSVPDSYGMELVKLVRQYVDVPELPLDRINVDTHIYSSRTSIHTSYYLDIDENTASELETFKYCNYRQVTVLCHDLVYKILKTDVVVFRSDETGEVQQVNIYLDVDKQKFVDIWSAAGCPDELELMQCEQDVPPEEQLTCLFKEFLQDDA